MTRTTTDRDVRQHVTQALGADADDYDVEAITRALIDRYGLNLGAIDEDSEYLWAVAADHQRDQAPDPGAAFRAELSAAMSARQIGEPATWHSDGVAVTVVGSSRVNHSWPQPLARLTITTPDGDVEELDGVDLASWEELWARVHTAAEQWTDATDTLLAHLDGAHRGLVHAEAAATQARARRDILVRKASAAGVSAYRIAKILGVAESTIGRIIAGGAR